MKEDIRGTVPAPLVDAAVVAACATVVVTCAMVVVPSDLAGSSF